MFPVEDGRTIPPMPEGSWSAATRSWWASVWSAPWATEYSGPDQVALERMAAIVQAFHDPGTSARDKLAMNTELRLAGQGLGLDAASRRRLGWDVQKPRPESTVQRLLREGRDPEDQGDARDYWRRPGLR